MSEPNNFQKLSSLISDLPIEELVRKNCYLERKNRDLERRLGIIEEALINKNDEHDKLVAELQHKNRDLERKYYKLLNAIETEGDRVQTQYS